MLNYTDGKFDIPSLVKDVLRQWWSILLVALAVTLFTNIYITYTYEPEYTTTTTFAVTARGNTSSIYSNLSSAQEIAERFTQVMDSNLLKKAVMEDLALDTYDVTTSAQQLGETNLVTLTVTASNAMESYQVLKSIMNNYGKVTDYLVGSVILQVVEEPEVPMAVSNPMDTHGPMKKAFLITVIIMIVYVGWFSYRRDTVKNEEQLKSKIDADHLGTIYHEDKIDRIASGLLGQISSRFLAGISGRQKRQKISMLIDNPMRSFFFVESNRMVASRVRSRMNQENAKVLLVTSVMENEGKSTVAANLALGIAQEGQKVLLIDADFRKPSQYKIFQQPQEKRVNLVEYLEGSETEEDLICQYKDTSLYLIANNKASRASGLLIDSENLRQLIYFYSRKMDYIILDTSPMALVSDTEALAKLADTAALVVREDAVLARNINDSVDILEQNGCRVLGSIYSNATRRRSRTSSYGYGHYYGGYYGKRKE